MNKILNIVSCGECGEIFAHKLDVTELNCPYCKHSSDISDFPDLYYTPNHHDSYVDISRPTKIQSRLEYLRGEIEKECISYGEIAELQSLAEHIDPSDVQLLEWAGVPENK